MDARDASRRALLGYGSAAAAALALLRFPAAWRRPSPAGRARRCCPGLDQPPPNPVPERGRAACCAGRHLDSYLTPADRFFTVAHYGQPAVDAQAWRLEVGGLVDRPLTPDPGRPPGPPPAGGGVHPGVLRQPRAAPSIGADRHRPLGRHAPGPPAGGGGRAGRRAARSSSGAPTPARRTVRDVAMTQHFARSMSLADATDPTVLLCYEMNGAPLPAGPRGPPAPDRPRLVRGGQRQVADPRRGAGHPPDEPASWPATTSPSARSPRRGGREPVWAETSVGRARLKSAPAKVTRLGGQHRIVGRGLGRPHRGGGGAGRRRALGAGDARPHARARTPLRLDAVGAGLGRAGAGGARRSPPGRPTRRARSSRRRTTPGSPASGPTGRAPARSPAASASPEPRTAPAGPRPPGGEIDHLSQRAYAGTRGREYRVGESSAPLEAPELPEGTVTFLFTDLEGSTRLLEAHPARLPGGRAPPPRPAAGRRRGPRGRRVRDGGRRGVRRLRPPRRRRRGAALAGQRALQRRALGRRRAAPGADGAAPRRGGAPGRALLRGAAVPLRPPDGERPRRAGRALGGHRGAGAATRCRRAPACGPGRAPPARPRSARSASSSSRAPGCPADFPPLRSAGGRCRTTCPSRRRRSSGGSSSSQAVWRAAAARRRAAADADRPGRHRQDPPGAAGRRRAAGQLSATGSSSSRWRRSPTPTWCRRRSPRRWACRRPAAGRSSQSLQDFLREKRLLLVLDNFEQVARGRAGGRGAARAPRPG